MSDVNNPVLSLCFEIEVPSIIQIPLGTREWNQTPGIKEVGEAKFVYCIVGMMTEWSTKIHTYFIFKSESLRIS